MRLTGRSHRSGSLAHVLVNDERTTMKSIIRWGAVAGATALAATSLFLAPMAASATTGSDGNATDGSNGTCGFGQRLVAIWDKLPEDLRADLQALRDLPDDERGEAARDIREGARDGEYGDAVQHHALRVRDRRAWIWVNLDDGLKADLKEIRDADSAAKPALIDDLAQNALDGAYGEGAQRVAERIQAHCE
jgi:hypothetical protein